MRLLLCDSYLLLSMPLSHRSPFSFMYQNAGCSVELGSLVYNPPRNGATLWEIGVPDRTADEFFVPTPPPRFKLHVYQSNSESMYDRKMFLLS